MRKGAICWQSLWDLKHSLVQIVRTRGQELIRIDSIQKVAELLSYGILQLGIMQVLYATLLYLFLFAYLCF